MPAPKRVYPATGRLPLWAAGVVGLVAAFTVVPVRYLTCGCRECGTSPAEQGRTCRRPALAHLELAYLVVYGLLVLTTVRQR